jgi:hypothetical protein
LRLDEFHLILGELKHFFGEVEGLKSISFENVEVGDGLDFALVADFIAEIVEGVPCFLNSCFLEV